MFSAELNHRAKTIALFFESAIKANKLSHAYLLCGSDDSFKDELALELTKILNCTARGQAEPACEKCTNCQWLAAKNHPELPIVLEPDLDKSKKGVVLVKQVQSLLAKIQNKSKFYRVVLLKKAENEFLPAESANSLLKTIEEPNSKILFLLYAKDRELVLPTIASRCQAVNLPSADIVISPVDNSSLAREIANDLFEENNNWFNISKLVLKVEKAVSVKDSPENENGGILGFLDQLIEICFECANNRLDEAHKWLLKIELIEITKRRLKSFCSFKPAMEELFWGLSR